MASNRCFQNTFLDLHQTGVQESWDLQFYNRSDEELEELREIVLSPERHTGEEDLDFYFHYRLVELSGNSIFMGIVNTYFDEIREIRDTNLKDVDRNACVQQEHLAIIDAICRRDEAAAARAVAEHMSRIWERWRLRNGGAEG